MQAGHAGAPEKRKGGLFAPGVTIVALGGIRVGASDRNLRVGALPDEVAVEVIHGLAVPGAVGGGDRDEQAGSDAVGARHGRRGLGNVSVGAAGEDEATQAAEDEATQAAEGEGTQAAEGEGAVGHEPMQQSRCQGLTPPARGFFTY